MINGLTIVNPLINKIETLLPVRCRWHRHKLLAVTGAIQLQGGKRRAGAAKCRRRRQEA
jgi:hypothetical protein